MEKVLLFVISFLIIYLLYFLTVVLQKKKYDKYKKSTQVMFFIKKYKLNPSKIKVGPFANKLAITNAFIMATTLTVIDLIPNFLLKMVVGFVILIPLILICYHFLGLYFKKREGK